MNLKKILFTSFLMFYNNLYAQTKCQFDIFDINKSIQSNSEHCMDVNNQSYSIKINNDRIKVNLKRKEYRRTFTIIKQDSIWIKVNKFKVISPGYPIQVDSTLYFKDNILEFSYWDNQILRFSCLLKVSDSLYYYHRFSLSWSFRTYLFKNISHFIQNGLMQKLIQIPQETYNYKCLVKCSGRDSVSICQPDTISDEYPLFFEIPWIQK